MKFKTFFSFSMLDKEEKPYLNTTAAIEYHGKSKSAVKPTAILQGILNRAALLGDAETLKYLKENGASELEELKLIEPLILSIEHKKENATVLLLDWGDGAAADDLLNYSDPQTRETLLHRAALKGSSKTCSRLISKNPKLDIDAKSKNKSTALHCAVFSGDLETVRVLMDAGASLKLKNNHKNTALSLASLHNYQDIISLLKNARTGVKTGDTTENSTKTDPLAPPSSSRISRIE